MAESAADDTGGMPAPVVSRVAPRVPWRAGLATVCLPGLGHLYAGAPRRGAMIWLAAIVSFFPIYWVGITLPLPLNLVAMCLVGAAFWIAIVRDAVVTVRRAPSSYMLRWYNRGYVYVGLVLAVPYLIVRPLRQHAEHHLSGGAASPYGAFRIPVGSMAPTLLSGDYVYTVPLRGMASRGDLVVYQWQGRKFVKRAVGLPGDTIAMRHDTLTVNGVVRAEPYITPSGDEDYAQRSNWGPLVVPAGTYFVLGDNRGNSLDSRYQGPIPVDSVVQRPAAIYFSRDSAGTIRWSRIGRDVHR